MSKKLFPRNEPVVAENRCSEKTGDLRNIEEDIFFFIQCKASIFKAVI